MGTWLGCREVWAVFMRLAEARKIFGLPARGELDEEELKKVYRREALRCRASPCARPARATPIPR